MNRMLKPIAATKRILIASLLSLSLFAWAAMPGLLSGPAPAYAERGPWGGTGITTTPPPGTTTGVAERVVGHPLTGGPGQATGAECRAYADARNGIEDYDKQAQKDGRPTMPNGQQISDAIGTAGAARGCTFMVVD
jgi:hypothetical protein